MNGKLHYLWRAVDQDGQVLDMLLQTRRDQRAAKRFFKKLLKGLRYVPRVVVTDKLRSYGAALKEILPSVEHRQHKGLILLCQIYLIDFCEQIRIMHALSRYKAQQGET
jgi:putative transposase